MNIVIFHTHAVMPNSQGVSKVLITLRKLFREKGHKIIVVAMRRFVTDTIDDESIYFLPNAVIRAQDNYEYLYKLLRENQINSTVNVCTDSDEIQLISDCCKKCNIPLTTCLHGMILTPIYSIAAVKEYSLRKHHLSLVYYILKSSLVVSLLSKIYILRYRKYYLNVYKLSDAVVLLSKTMKKEYLRMIGIKRSEKIFVIPNTIESEDKSVSNNKKNVVLWVGKMDTSIKRPDLMLRIWQKVEPIRSNWHLKMLGKGNGNGEAVLEEMKGLAKKLHLKNVSFEGQVNTYPYYEEAKIVCVTSTHESFSLVLVEALSHGVVPVAFDSFPTANELVLNEINGLLIKPYNVERYALALSKLMNDTQWLGYLQSNRFRTTDDYENNVVYRKWEELFSNL